MYPLTRRWRHRPGVVDPGVDLPPPPPWTLAPGEGLDRAHWAQTDFGNAPVGHAAIGKRLIRSAAIQAMAPMKTVFSAACGDEAAVMGYDRMIDRADGWVLTPETMLVPHRARTLCRMRAQATVWAIQDGSELNGATHRACKGLGVIARTKGSFGKAYDLCGQRRRRAAGPSAHRVRGTGRSGGHGTRRRSTGCGAGATPAG